MQPTTYKYIGLGQSAVNLQNPQPPLYIPEVLGTARLLCVFAALAFWLKHQTFLVLGVLPLTPIIPGKHSP